MGRWLTDTFEFVQGDTDGTGISGLEMSFTLLSDIFFIVRERRSSKFLHEQRELISSNLHLTGHKNHKIKVDGEGGSPLYTRENPILDSTSGRVSPGGWMGSSTDFVGVNLD